MELPTKVRCEQCGAEASVLSPSANANDLAGISPSKKAEQGLYVLIACPNCGERQQQVAARPDP
jgi:ribosomal protein S27E